MCGTPCTGSTASKIAAGAAGLGKVLLQSAGVPVDAAPPDLVKARRDICRMCPHATRNASARFAKNAGLTTLSRCDKCECIIAAKTRLRSEVCPVGKW